MIAIDLDGTLLSPGGEVTPRTKAAVQRALRSGLLVCFATGRNFIESQTVLDAVSHYDSAVFVGGAMVIDTRQRITLHRTLMEPQLARELCDFFESHGHAAMALQDHGTADFDYLISQGVNLDHSTRRWLAVTPNRVAYRADLRHHSHEHTMRISMVASVDESRRVHAELVGQFGERITSHPIYVQSVGSMLIEVFDPAVNKWEGIMHIARRHGVEPREIIAIGDDVNDIPMIRNAGLGVAMGNAQPELLEIADVVIARNGEDGLAKFLEELVADQMVEPMPDESEKQ
jgi:Cof subfamily protein (haloacid dehalogenase superfamily)